MTSPSRRTKEREDKKRLILDTAGDIIAKEGIGNLSIRKIASTIGYSPAVIYHYFQGKEEIIAKVLEDGYRGMVVSLKSAAAREDASPEIVLKETLRRFIETSVADGARYRNVMLSDSPEVLAHTSVLFRGAAREREALTLLCRQLRGLERLKEKEEEDIERTAQVIWTGAFGLIIRLTVEENLPREQRQALIGHYLEMTLTMVGHL